MHWVHNLVCACFSAVHYDRYVQCTLSAVHLYTSFNWCTPSSIISTDSKTNYVHPFC